MALADLNRTGFTAPDGSTDTYTYDTLNRLATLANSWAGSFGFSYDALSRRTQMTRPNSITTNYTYDTLSRLLSVLHQAGSSTIDGATYTLDAAGNRTVKTDDLAGVTSNYTYDKIYELTQVMQGTNTTESYSYDAVGNRTASLGVSSYTNNSSNELTSTSNASYTYDYNGNTTSKTDSTGTPNYTWDLENRLTQVTLPGTGGTVSFKYDPLGRRIYKSSSNGTSIFAFDGANLIEQVNGSGTVIARYADGQGIDEPLAELNSGATSYYEQDGLGSVTSLSNTAGALVDTYRYDSFGQLTGSAGTISNSLQYTARESDSETNLYYYRARYYDETTGRFLSEDPEGFEEANNFYPYARNDPTNMVDPSGRLAEVLCERVHQYWLGYWVGGTGARHCRIHVKCDDCHSKYGNYDRTYELTGKGPGSLLSQDFDPHRPVNPRVPVTPPSGGKPCSFENCVVDRFLFDYNSALRGQPVTPDYGPVNANSNAFVYVLVSSCGGKMSYPGFWHGFFGQMPDP